MAGEDLTTLSMEVSPIPIPGILNVLTDYCREVSLDWGLGGIVI